MNNVHCKISQKISKNRKFHDVEKYFLFLYKIQPYIHKKYLKNSNFSLLNFIKSIDQDGLNKICKDQLSWSLYFSLKVRVFKS